MTQLQVYIVIHTASVIFNCDIMGGKCPFDKHRNVEQFPDDDNYRRVRISSEQFSSKVWDYPCCQDFLIRAGWMEVRLQNIPYDIHY